MKLSQVIYQASQNQFFQDVVNNRIVRIMEKEAERQGLTPGKSEKRSWENNAPKVMELLKCSEISDTYVTFEYLLPRRLQRIDCMIYGKDTKNRMNAVHIELKQWSNNTVSASSTNGNFNLDNGSVEALTGGQNRIVAHPSQQVRGYHDYMTHFIEIVSNEELKLTGVAYCYNYVRYGTQENTALYNPIYNQLQKQYRTYAKDELPELANKIHEILAGGDGFSIFNKMMSSRIVESQKLLDSIAGMLQGDLKCKFNLLDDQITAKNEIFDKIRKLKLSDKKSIIVVHGGPGTGKTVIALDILSSLAKTHYQVRYATKSASLVSAIHYQLPRGHTAKHVITGLTEFNPMKCAENELDVLLVDEAHRVESFYYTGFGRAKRRASNLPMIDSLLRASKILVMFIDDKQAIRSSEIGSTRMIKDCAVRNQANIVDVQLVSQFRCNGSDNYLDWIDQLLYNKKMIAEFSQEDYDFQVFDSPQELYSKLKEKISEKEHITARLMAGFCWPWSNKLDENGQPVKDVVIGDFAMPWETHRNFRTVPEGYVKWNEWAYRPEGFKQVGCIYTAQGFEFDYAGVIIGPDIEYDAVHDCLITNIKASKDPTLVSRKGIGNFDTYVRNIYRVLMTRGMKGTYIYCCSAQVKEYIKQHLKRS